MYITYFVYTYNIGYANIGCNDAIYNKADDTKVISDILSRFLIYDDPDTSKKWRESFLKILIGCAEANRRGIYKLDTNHRIRASVYFNFNQPPQIETVVPSVRRRFKFFICNSRFVEDESEVNEDEHIYWAESMYMSVPWRNKYRMAMWHILNDYWQVFKQQNFKFQDYEEPMLWDEFYEEYGGVNGVILDDSKNNYRKKKKMNDTDLKFIAELSEWIKTSKFKQLTADELKVKYGAKRFWPYITCNQLLNAMHADKWWENRSQHIKNRWRSLEVALSKLLPKMNGWNYKRHAMRNKQYIYKILIGWKKTR